MSYLIQIANRRPMLRITAEVIIVFCCAAPLVLVVSSLVAYGVHSDELIDARSIGDPLISARLLDAPDVVAL